MYHRINVELLPLACRGPARRGARHPCPEAAEYPAAKRFFKRLLTGVRHKPSRIVTDGLRSYGVVHREILPDVRHRTSRYLNNRAENSHRPTRRRERQMQRFKSPEQAQHFLSVHGMIYGHFHPRRHFMTADQYRWARDTAFRLWQAVGDVRSNGSMKSHKLRRTSRLVCSTANVTMLLIPLMCPAGVAASAPIQARPVDLPELLQAGKIGVLGGHHLPVARERRA